MSRICIGCGHSDSVPIRKPAIACCPDSDYRETINISMISDDSRAYMSRYASRVVEGRTDDKTVKWFDCQFVVNDSIQVEVTYEYKLCRERWKYVATICRILGSDGGEVEIYPVNLKQVIDLMELFKQLLNRRK